MPVNSRVRSGTFALSPEMLNVVVVLFILSAHNRTMFSRAASLATESLTLVYLAIMAFGLTLAIITLLSYFGLRWLQKIALAALLILSALTAFYTDSLGAIFDEELVNNILTTHPSEGAPLINPAMIGSVLLLGVLPAILVLICPLKRRGLVRNTLAWGVTILIGLGCFAGAKALGYKAFVQVSRGEMNSVTYALQPGAFLVATTSLLENRWKVWGLPFTLIGLDARRGAKIAKAPKPVVLFLVVGETARAQNQQIDGYVRETNPQLSKRDILNFGPATSCATSTIPSLRCMFSKFDRVEMSYVKFATHENLLDIAAHAKIGVEWYDNDWTFAEGGVTDRIKVERLYQRHDLAACVSGECDDAVFFDFMDQVIAQTTTDKLVVIHLVGSHFPYYRRYPAAFEVFKPACNSPVLSTCTPQEIINAYDNSIRYTDYILAHFIDTLSQQTKITPALIYTSDHGESLGENGVFLHSAPRSMAPPEQTSVPFFLWLSQPYIQAFNVDMPCLRQKATAAVAGATTSHDNFFSTALGLLDIQTAEHKAALDLTAGCM